MRMGVSGDAKQRCAILETMAVERKREFVENDSAFDETTK
jgi:hypothetical protein